MRKILIAGVIAATLTPAVAQAQRIDRQERRELRRDRQDVREERRELNQARRTGDRGDIREERREYRGAVRELREDRVDARRDWNRNDWRGWRDHNRNTYARGHWRAPFRYRVFRPGVRLSVGYYSPRYYIADPWRYRLPRALSYQRWVRHYDDVLLVDIRTGRVIDVIRGFYW